VEELAAHRGDNNNGDTPKIILFLPSFQVNQFPAIDKHGLSEEVLIDKYLRPLLEAERTVFFPKDGKVKQKVKVAALEIQLAALKELFRLHGSYAPCDPKEAATFGVKVVVLDMPRPK
jgi:hypothetical protein